jgi:hypothetical protein
MHSTCVLSGKKNRPWEGAVDGRWNIFLFLLFA